MHGRLMRMLFPFAAWVGLAVSAHGQWRVVSQSAERALGAGAWLKEKKIAGRTDAELKMTFFDAKQCSLRVVGQPAGEARFTVEDAARSVGALAACNGGFFTKEFKPLGLMVAGGVRTGVFESGPLLTGVIMVKKGKPLMLWRDEFSDGSSISDLLQAGPRLVNNGVAVPGLQGGKARARTFVATDNAGHWVLGLCRYVSLADLGDMLASGKVLPELEIARALNLDGGSSSGFWTRDAGGRESYDAEFATVRNFLAVLPRQR